MYSYRGDTDFIWQQQLINEPTTLIVYYQAEQGLAPLLAGASLVSEEEPACKIFSKLHQVEPMNTIPTPTYPEWRLYCKYNTEGRRFFILRVNHAYIPNASQTKSWLYNYPVFRDIMLELNDYGVEELLYLTSNVMQDYQREDQLMLRNHELIVYEHNTDTMKILPQNYILDDDVMLIPSPSWVVCNVFENFSVKNKSNKIVVCARDINTYLDTEPAEALLLYLYSNYNLEWDNVYYREMCAVLSEVEHLGADR